MDKPFSREIEPRSAITKEDAYGFVQTVYRQIKRAGSYALLCAAKSLFDEVINEYNI